MAKLKKVTFELLSEDVERGPKGTVPVVRRDLSKLRPDQTLSHCLSKYPNEWARSRAGLPRGASEAPPSPEGYFHALIGQYVKCFGCRGALSVWDPYVGDPKGHSLMQTYLGNSENNNVQTLEAGWTVDHNLHSDWAPHLFTWFTTNNYAAEGNNIGGYDAQQDGWVQVDANIFPGALISPDSAIDGPQFYLFVQYQWVAGNWWFLVNGIPIGYYPASLFSVGVAPGTSLADHADLVQFYGEVYTSPEQDPLTTNSQMGSGRFAEGGINESALGCALEYSVKVPGLSGWDVLSDVVPFTSAEQPGMYDVLANIQPPATWGSNFFAGGPGAGSTSTR